MDVIELQNLSTERKLRIGPGEQEHPFLIVTKNSMMAIHTPFNMILQLVNELLLVETIYLLRDEGLIMTEGRDDTAHQGHTLSDTTNLMDRLVNSPALGHQLLNLL